MYFEYIRLNITVHFIVIDDYRTILESFVLQQFCRYRSFFARLMGLIILHFLFLTIRIIFLFHRFIYLFRERTLAFTHVNSEVIVCIMYGQLNGVCFLFLIKLFIDKIFYKIFLFTSMVFYCR